MMLEWLAELNNNNDRDNLINLGKKIESTLISLLEENIKTIDVDGNMHTDEFTRAFVSKLIL
jgi:3-isopropylmalate dehydrogenase